MPVSGVKVVFQDVNVRVKDTVILKNVSGEAVPGQLLAIMGPSGKSSIYLYYCSYQHSGASEITSKLHSKVSKQRKVMYKENVMPAGLCPEIFVDFCRLQKNNEGKTALEILAPFGGQKCVKNI